MFSSKKKKKEIRSSKVILKAYKPFEENKSWPCERAFQCYSKILLSYSEGRTYLSFFYNSAVTRISRHLITGINTNNGNTNTNYKKLCHASKRKCRHFGRAKCRTPMYTQKEKDNIHIIVLNHLGSWV